MTDPGDHHVTEVINKIRSLVTYLFTRRSKKFKLFDVSNKFTKILLPHLKRNRLQKKTCLLLWKYSLKQEARNHLTILWRWKICQTTVSSSEFNLRLIMQACFAVRLSTCDLQVTKLITMWLFIVFTRALKISNMTTQWVTTVFLKKRVCCFENTALNKRLRFKPKYHLQVYLAQQIWRL